MVLQRRRTTNNKRRLHGTPKKKLKNSNYKYIGIISDEQPGRKNTAIKAKEHSKKRTGVSLSKIFVQSIIIKIIKRCTTRETVSQRN